jgi:hypothetical protein
VKNCTNKIANNNPRNENSPPIKNCINTWLAARVRKALNRLKCESEKKVPMSKKL